MNTGISNKYADFRCINPGSLETKGPWFPLDNVCPCDPKLSNPTGRGYVSCGFGVQFKDPKIDSQQVSYTPPDVGTTYGIGSNFPVIDKLPVISAPQLDPRPLSLIGYTWRS